VSEIRVRVADFAVARGAAVLTTVGLGSCVAIMLYDAATQIGALAHILLPDETLSRETENRAKFATTAVPLLLDTLRHHGVRQRPVAKLVGGASMFASLIPAGALNVGERNIIAAREALAQAGLALIGEDTGGDYGRSVSLHTCDGRVVVKSLRGKDCVL
jgi:chemotaxis protein CheD